VPDDVSPLLPVDAPCAPADDATTQACVAPGAHLHDCCTTALGGRTSGGGRGFEAQVKRAHEKYGHNVAQQSASRDHHPSHADCATGRAMH
jgi:hypothetical protein